MPVPVSAIVMATNSPESPSSDALPRITTGFAVMVSVPPDGMASRALKARLSSASSNSLGSTLTKQDRRRSPTRISMSPRSEPLGKIDHARLQHLPPREGEQLARQAFAALCRLGDGVEQAYLVVAGNAPAQTLHGAAHDHQQIIEIVGDAAGQLSDRFESLRLPQCIFRQFAALGLVVQPLGAPQRDPQHD